MGNRHALTSIQFGKHASTTDVTSTPGTLYTPEFQVDAPTLLPRDYEHVEKNTLSVSNYRYAPMIGKPDLSPITLRTHLKGLAAPTGGPSTGTTGLELGPLLDVFMGGTAAAPVGAQTTATGGNGATPTLLIAAANISAGDFVVFKTSLGWQANYVASAATTTLTLQFPYGGTVTSGEIVYRGPKWSYSRAVGNHIHGYIDAEGEGWRRIYKGLIPSKFSIDIPIGGHATATHEWMPSSWDEATPANPSPVTFMNGKVVYGYGNVTLGANSYCLKSIKVDYTNTVRDRECMNSDSGREGGTVMNKDCTFTLSLHMGDDSGFREIDDDALQAFYAKEANKSSSATYDVFVQIGNEPGGMWMWRIPLADCKFKTKVENGEEMVDVTVGCVGSAMLFMGVA